MTDAAALDVIARLLKRNRGGWGFDLCSEIADLVVSTGRDVGDRGDPIVVPVRGEAK